MEGSGLSPTRVLHMISTGQVGGTEKHVASLLTGFDPSEFDLRVVLFRPGPLESAYAASAQTKVIEKNKRYDLRFLLSLTREVKAQRPSVVHTWNSTANLWGSLAARLGGVRKIIVSEEEMDLWKGPVWRLIDRVLARWAHVVVGNADAVCAASVERGVPREKVRTIRNALRAPVDLGKMPRDPMLIVLLGRIDPRKGHDVAMRAFSRVLTRFPEAKLHFAGAAVHPPEKGFEQELLALREELGLTERLVFLGHVADPWSLLRTAGVVISASHSEGSPNVLLEASATGAPVVATAVGGATEIFDGTTAVLVPPNDADALAEGVLEAMGNWDQALARAERARTMVLERFSPDRAIEAWTNLYREALGEGFPTKIAG